jgi:predicted lactoylglutathione lyase
VDNKQKVRILELSFNIMEKLLMSKDFKSKEEVMDAAKKAVAVSNKDEKMPLEIKMGYAEAYKKLDTLTWEEIVEIKQIISED